MQRSTYGILAAGMIAASTVAVIVQQSAQLREADLHRRRIEDNAERLCKALKASRLLVSNPTAAKGQPRQNITGEGLQVADGGLSATPEAGRAAGGVGGGVGG